MSKIILIRKVNDEECPYHHGAHGDLYACPYQKPHPLLAKEKIKLILSSWIKRENDIYLIEISKQHLNYGYKRGVNRYEKKIIKTIIVADNPFVFLKKLNKLMCHLRRLYKVWP